MWRWGGLCGRRFASSPRRKGGQLAVVSASRYEGVSEVLALGLVRKPAFPGYYQVLQTHDPALFAQLSAHLARHPRGCYVGAFLTRSEAGAPGALREDVRAAPRAELHDTGALVQVLSVIPHAALRGGQAVLMPLRRITMTGAAPTAGRSDGTGRRYPQFCIEDTLSGRALAWRPGAGKGALRELILGGTAAGGVTPQGGTEGGSLMGDGMVAGALVTRNGRYRARIASKGTITSGPGAWRRYRGALLRGPSSAALPRVVIEQHPEAQVKWGALAASEQALHMELVITMKELLKTSYVYKEHFDQIVRYYNLDYPERLCDLVAGLSLADRAALQRILSAKDVRARLTHVLLAAKRDLEFARLQDRVKGQVEEQVGGEQRRLLLLEQLKFIKRELGYERDEKESAVEALAAQFEERRAAMPEVVRTAVSAERARLASLDPASSEFNVTRTYLETVLSIPWGVYTPTQRDIARAEAILDEDHFGLKDIKTRILEFIAVQLLRESTGGRILCLVGPPGVGKTSVGASVARALKREFYSLSLGGLSDVSELRGHRRTYVGAMPGKLVQALRQTKTSNPVVLLDEVDKLGRDRGDPASVLLEVLDPAQNNAFRDSYVDLPVDLSRVLFLCTANTTDSIPAPLLDRMEVIRLPGYLHSEKVAIAKRFLVPAVSKAAGVPQSSVAIAPDALDALIHGHAREPGVRALKKCVEKIYRKVALQYVREKGVPPAKVDKSTEPAIEEVLQDIDRGAAGGVKVPAVSQTTSSEASTSTDPDTTPETIGAKRKKSPKKRIPRTQVQIGVSNLTDYVGQPRFTNTRAWDGDCPVGVATGLAWTPVGGVTLHIESMAIHDGVRRAVKTNIPSVSVPGLNPGISPAVPLANEVTSSEVHPSAQAPVTPAPLETKIKVTGHLGDVMKESCEIAHSYVSQLVAPPPHVHIHVPAGGTPKDGPSAGVAICSALLSLARGAPLSARVAMTGELSLTGRVHRVGGIREKTLAAKQEGVTHVLLPEENRADWLEIDEEAREGLTAHFVSHYNQVEPLLFGPNRLK